MIFDETDCIMTQPISRGQLYKLLKKNFLKCIKFDCKYEICQYYTSYPYQGAEVIRNTKLILTVSNTVIKSTRSPQYSMEQSDKIKALMASKYGHNNLFNNNDINRINWCLGTVISIKQIHDYMPSF
ncbi:hypothetical protein A6770_36665 [Nostoc minutum NIES-26]|uniref:Uncharacterized protein n=1 Tax=Nostoc minutum NIES-26 TaxID=1844469 RepID=A0A367RWU2_9NOSO|nr:hypothetical protein A6770_36665 [Nostoc minutum NIES-26]